MAKILVADDHVSLSISVSDWLKSSEHQVDMAHSADEARSMIESFQYDLILLDWEFPDGAGLDIITSFRQNGGLTPILMLTGKTAIEDKERGLDAGADDYVTKPFHLKELGARIRALLRRPPVLSAEELKVGDLVLNTSTRKVFLAGQEVKLQPMETTVLEFFMRNPGQPFGPESIIQRVWESSTEVSLHAVYSCVKRLRQKLAQPGKESMMRTLRGAGYELVAN